MNKMFLLLASSAILVGVASHRAEARKVSYEIDGKRYSYSTNNIAQTAEAKARIEAARAAEAARAKAMAEKGENPLATVFGSQAQREAVEAQNKLEYVLVNGGSSTEIPKASPERRSAWRGKPAKDAKTGAAPLRTAPSREPSPALKTLVAIAPPAIAEPLSQEDRARKVKTISFDVQSGIKTTVMIDGAVEEEPFDSSVLAQLAPNQGESHSLMAFVKRLRPALQPRSEEATGSIQPKPEAEASAQALPRN
jgi:hypothetical protein